MNFNFTFHDNGGRVVKKFCCEADCYDEAYEKANKAACEIPQAESSIVMQSGVRKGFIICRTSFPI